MEIVPTQSIETGITWLLQPLNVFSSLVQSWTSFSGQNIVFGTVDIFVIFQPKWLKFGLQAHFLKVFGHTKFQLSISYTFKVMKLLVEITKYITKSLITESIRDRELKFCLS